MNKECRCRGISQRGISQLKSAPTAAPAPRRRPPRWQRPTPPRASSLLGRRGDRGDGDAADRRREGAAASAGRAGRRGCTRARRRPAQRRRRGRGGVLVGCSRRCSGRCSTRRSRSCCTSRARRRGGGDRPPMPARRRRLRSGCSPAARRARSASVFNPTEVVKTHAGGGGVDEHGFRRAASTARAASLPSGRALPNVARTFLVNAAELGTYDEAKSPRPAGR